MTKMYKVTCEVAFEVLKRIWRPCCFPVGVGEGSSHSEDSDMKNGCGATQGLRLKAHWEN